MSKSIELSQNSLVIQQGKSSKAEVICVLSEKALTDCLQRYDIKKACLVVWQVNKICWGKWDQEILTFADNQPISMNLWLEIRIFNEREELHLIRQQGKLKGYLLKDGQGEEMEYIDSLSRFWGRKKTSADGWLVLEDSDRKLRQVIPQPAEDANYYGLITRNYIGINPKTAQAGYVEYRYVAVVSADIKGDVQNE